MMIGLSKHIEILLLSNDCVIVPGFGGFMAYHIDARKDPADGSFLPPIRSIGFNPKLTINDSLLAQSYVEAYDMSYPDATKRIEDEVRELRQRLENDGSYEFRGIGTISINSEGNYEFAPCEAGILSPTLYGLGSFQMATVASLRAKSAVTADNAEDSADRNAVISLKPEKNDNDSAQNGKKTDRHSARLIALWRNVAVACIAVILFLLIPSPLVNNAQLAGTGIDVKLLDKVMPKNITTGEEGVSKAVRNSQSKIAAARPAIAAKAEAEKAVAKAEKTEPAFSIVVASHVTLANARVYANDLQQRGYTDAFVRNIGHVKVLIGHFASRSDAAEALNKLNDSQEFAGAWITTIK